MDAMEQWRKDEATEAAEAKLAEAEVLVEEAESILRSVGREHRADDAARAIGSIRAARPMRFAS